MKKILVCLAVFLCFFSSFFLAGCNDTTTVKETIVKESDIAILSIFSYDGGSSYYGIFNLGHSFLSIKNVSEQDITLAGKTIDAGEEIYIGAWSLSAHFGIWYNIENNKIDIYGSYDGRVSVSTGISNEDVKVLSDFILNNDIWTPLKNCSCFAINAWNSVVEDTEKLNSPLIYTPSNLKKQIKSFKNYETNKELAYCAGCGYFADLTRTTFEFKGNEFYV